MVVFYNIWKKNNEIQLIKNEMDQNNLKMKNYLSPNKITNRHAMWEKFSMYGGG